jgi:hypothetical protein
MVRRMNTSHQQFVRSEGGRTGRLSTTRRGGEQQLGVCPLTAVTLALVLVYALGCGSRDSPSHEQTGRDTSVPTAVAAGKSQAALPATDCLVKDATQYPNEEYNASIVQILAHRDRYHGKEVQVKGYLRVEFEGTAIYLSKEDADYGMTRNGFWVSFDKRTVPYKGLAGPVQFNRKYVLIEGTFDKDLMGHWSAWQGTIKNVSRVMELSKHD